MIRVLLVDDHALFREGTRALLSGAPNIEVIGESSNGDEALSLVQILTPDVLLLDIRLEGASGIEVVRRLHGQRFAPKVLILSAYSYETYVRNLFAMGVHGYLLKSASGQELIEAVNAVHRGDQVIGKGLGNGHSSDGRRSAVVAGGLSERELDVLCLVRDGASNRDIAERLQIGVRTVESYLSHAMAKLGACSRTEAVNLAMRSGIMGNE